MEISNPDEEELDSDVLQNNINMSFSHAFDLVSTWMKPPRSSASMEETKRLSEEKAFENFGRRPLRLGVGAPLPTSGPSARETTNLLRKLSNKKRGREGEDKAHSDRINGRTSGGNQKEIQFSSDDEDSRAKAISSNKRLKSSKAINDAFQDPKQKKSKVNGPSDAFSKPHLNIEPRSQTDHIDITSPQPLHPTSPQHLHSGSPAPSDSKSVSTTSTAVPPSFHVAEQSHTSQLKPSSTANALSMNETPRSTPMGTQSQSSGTSSPISTTFPTINNNYSPRKVIVTSPRSLEPPLLNLSPIASGFQVEEGTLGSGNERKKKKKKRRRKNKSQGMQVANGGAEEGAGAKDGPVLQVDD